MKKFYLLSCALLLASTLAAQTTTPYLYHSNTGNWGATGIGANVYRGTLGVKSHRFTFAANFSGGNFYKINNQGTNSDNDFNAPGGSKVWSGTLSLGTLGTAFAYGDGNGGAGSFPITSGKYYTFNWEDVNTSTNARCFALETDSDPVSISSLSYIPTNPTPSNSVTVTVVLAGTPSAQEKVYLRYSTNGFSTYGTLLNPTSGSGTSVQTFSIPAQVNNTAVAFYAFTSTLSFATLDGAAAITDLGTIYYDNNSGSNYTYVSLPIELTRFEANAAAKSVVLDWQTATESRNSHFDIENSQDAQNWKTLAEVPGQGNSLVPHQYTWTHEQPTPGVNYYRLRQVDWDGSFAFSSVVKASIGRSVHATVAPNPLVGNVLQIKLDAESTEETSLQLFGSQGQLVRNLHTLATTGEWLTLDVSDLPEGIYWLVVNNGTPVKVVR